MIPQEGDRVTVGSGTCEYIVLYRPPATLDTPWILQGPMKRRYVQDGRTLHVVPRSVLDAVHEERAGRR